MLEGHILSSYARALTRLPPNQNDKVTLTVADVEEFFRTSAGVQTINTIQTPIDPERVIQVVCSFYQIRPLHIRQQNRLEHISRARHVCMYILREKLGLGLTTIAQILKRKDHTTIIHGVGKIRADILNNPILKNEIDTLCQNLKLSP
jgi:chromosomal replication initiation ATPase DnaA